VGKFWSLFFLGIPLLGTAVFVLAALDVYPFQGHWFPELVVSDQSIDHLFYFILYMTGVVFIGTGLMLCWILWKYDSKQVEAPEYSHGNHFLEIIWTVIPAILLLIIAVYQMDAWANARMRRPQLADGSPVPAMARVTGRQFEWRIQYPGQDGKFDTPDDIHVINDLHVPADDDVVIDIESDDVLHSFFLPNFRVKQDVVPGMKQTVWFHPTKSGSYDIVCAELCGWGHYKMKGQITVQPKQQYEDWLDQAYREQETTEFSLAETE